MRASTGASGMEIVLSRCRLRPFREGDQASIVRYANNRRVWLNLRDAFPHPYTRSDSDAWVRRVAGHAPPTQFGIEVAGEVVGGIGLTLQEDVHRRSAEIGYWLGEPFWGRGLMSEVVPAFTAYAIATFDVRRLYATVFEWNHASARVLEKSGYVLEGRLRKSVVKDGHTIDQLLFAYVRE
jgi:[ribosomal protein S5]-alanine N-acetyltransferase